jgi:transcription elongation factor SPT6
MNSPRWVPISPPFPLTKMTNIWYLFLFDHNPSVTDVFL